jgi:hypothetical protein
MLTRIEIDDFKSFEIGPSRIPGINTIWKVSTPARSMMRSLLFTVRNFHGGWNTKTVWLRGRTDR